MLNALCPQLVDGISDFHYIIECGMTVWSVK